MSYKILKKPVFALVFGAILALAAWGVVAAQPPEIKEPAGVSLAVDTLKGAIAEAEASKDLSDTDKKNVISNLDAGIRFLEETDRLNAEAQRITEAVAAAPKRIKEIQAKLKTKDPASSKADDIVSVSRMTKEQLEQRAREKKAALATARDTLKSYRESLEKLKNQPAQLQKEIADNKGKLAALDNALKKEIPPDEPGELTEARRAAIRAERSMRLSKIRLFEKQLLNSELLVSLTTAEQDLATLDVKRKEAESQKWESIAIERRRQEAKMARVVAETAKALTPDLPPAIKKQYDINIQLSKTLEKLTGDQAYASRMLEQRQSVLKMLEEEYTRTRQRIQNEVLTEMSGITLRQRRQALPSPERYRRDSKERQLAMGKISEAQFNIDEKHRALLDLQNEKTRILQSMGKEYAENQAEWEDKIQALLTDRRNLKKKLQAAYRRNYKNLQSIEFIEQQLAAKTEEYAGFLDSHLLWIRSSKIFGPKDLHNLPGAILWIASPYNWLQSARDLAGSFRHAPFILILGLLFAGAFFIRRHWARRKMVQLTEKVGRVKQDSVLITFQALGLTAYLAAAWPSLLIVAGWRLAVFPQASDFSQSISHGLIQAGFFLVVLSFMYYVCQNNGLAQIHFRWPDLTRLTLRRHLSWLIPLYLACGFVAVSIQAANQPAYADSLGRLMFITATAAFAVFAVKMLPVFDGSSLASKGGTQKSRLLLKFLWYFLAIALPGLMVALAVMGYYYSASRLDRQFDETALLLIALLVGNSLVLRWLVVAQRRLAYEEAIEKRRERLEAERALQGDPLLAEGRQAIESFEIEEPEITRAQINEQTRSLLRTTLFFSAILGLWAIWNDVLPALNVLENITLWRYSVEMDGVTRVMPITLVHVLAAVVVAAITFVASRNLPGVLEISLLQYLPMDAGARYAFSAICRYAVSAVGFIIAFNYIGISWSSLKWLAAALSVGIGFGLQEIVANFISGLIILFERPVRVGDVVTVDNIDGVVSRIRIRATTITNWDRKEYLVPNKEFITGRLLNWSLSNPIIRIVIPVGVVYGSDTEKTHELLLKVAHAHEGVLEDPAPTAVFQGFGDNALNFTLRCFIPSMDNYIFALNGLHMAIDKAFRDAGINIAFPQRDIHFDSDRPLKVHIASDRGEKAEPWRKPESETE